MLASEDLIISEVQKLSFSRFSFDFLSPLDCHTIYSFPPVPYTFAHHHYLSSPFINAMHLLYLYAIATSITITIAFAAPVCTRDNFESITQYSDVAHIDATADEKSVYETWWSGCKEFFTRPHRWSQKSNIDAAQTSREERMTQTPGLYAQSYQVPEQGGDFIKLQRIVVPEEEVRTENGE